MKFQEYIVEATRKAAAEAFRYAKVVPADKIDWSPLDKGRSVLDQCRELAMTPTWAAEIIEGVPMDWSPEAMAAVKQEQSQWTTVEVCEAEFNRRLERMVSAFNGVTDEGLKNTKFLPFDGGRDFTFAEMMEYPRWNATYHLGQIAYVQILYGDGEMH
jgi:hypothetical protein